MKKILFLLAVIVAVMASCEGEEGPMGRDGRDGKDGNANYESIEFKVGASDWKLEGNPNDIGAYYYIDFNVTEITPYVYDYGTVIGYIEVAADIKNGLPFTSYNGILGETPEDGDVFWSKKYDFDFSPGNVRFKVTYSDFITSVSPESTTFYVVLIW